MTEHQCPSIGGNIEAIEQSLALCNQLNSQNYTFKAEPYVQSSIGEHLRHIIDLYLALVNQPETGIVDYDQRRRGAKVESELNTGIAELKRIREWLLSLTPDSLDKPINILSEASVKTQRVCEVTSSLKRELLFVGSHTIHHLALIKVITTHAGIETCKHLGYAPATATYLRGQA